MPFPPRNNLGNTALHLAAAYCRLDVIRFLLEAGCPVNATNCRGETALNLALHDGFMEVVPLLQAAGGCSNALLLPQWPPKFQVCYWSYPTQG